MKIVLFRGELGMPLSVVTIGRDPRLAPWGVSTDHA
jgi:hypothetical protein